MMTDRAALTALTVLGSLLGHQGGDYLLQPDWCAVRKQERTTTGRLALAGHVAIYSVAQAATKAALYRVAGVRVPVLAQLAGAAAEAAAHAVIDDGRLLARLAAGLPEPEAGSRAARLRALAHQVTDKSAFHDLAEGGVNGRMLMDQAAHVQAQVPIGAAVTVAATALLARWRSRRG